MAEINTKRPRCEFCRATVTRASAEGETGSFCRRCLSAYWRGVETGGVPGAGVPLPPPTVDPSPRFSEIFSGHPEFSRVKQTVALPLTRAFRVDNPALADVYEMCREDIRRQMGAPPEERIMFHGTARPAAGSIARSGFDIRYAGKINGQALGRGIYFSSDPDEALRYAIQSPDIAGNVCLVVARVVVGRRRVAGGDGRPRRGGGELQDRVSEVVHSYGSGSIVVIRREQQADPLYVLYLRQ